MQKNKQAKGYYEQFGFIPLPDNPLEYLVYFTGEGACLAAGNAVAADCKTPEQRAAAKEDGGQKESDRQQHRFCTAQSGGGRIGGDKGNGHHEG